MYKVGTELLHDNPCLLRGTDDACRGLYLHVCVWSVVWLSFSLQREITFSHHVHQITTVGYVHPVLRL